VKMKPFEVRVSVQSARTMPAVIRHCPTLQVECSSPRIAIRRVLDAELGNRSRTSGRYADRQLERGEILFVSCRRGPESG